MPQPNQPFTRPRRGNMVGIFVLYLLFLMMKAINKLMAKKEEPAPEPETPAGPTQEELLAEIRDLLKEK